MILYVPTSAIAGRVPTLMWYVRFPPFVPARLLFLRCHMPCFEHSYCYPLLIYCRSPLRRVSENLMAIKK
jgi:hypothetical protein